MDIIGLIYAIGLVPLFGFDSSFISSEGKHNDWCQQSHGALKRYVFAFSHSKPLYSWPENYNASLKLSRP